MDKNKLVLPVTILLASIILGGFYYSGEINKQQSIERQQEIKLQEDRGVEEAKAEQNKKEYIAKRKSECYDIYEKERDEYDNVVNGKYDEEKSVCIITYSTDKYKGEDCEKYRTIVEARNGQFIDVYDECISGTFTKEF